MSDYDELNLPRPAWRFREIAILGGGHEDDLAIAGGYHEVAEIATREWIAHGPIDGLPLPIFFLYRHSIELPLKWLIRIAARCALRDEYTGVEDLSADKLDEKLNTHSIKKLADRLDTYMRLLTGIGPDNKIDPASWELLQWLDSEDETGETFRYTKIGRAETRARPVQENINFYELVNDLHKVAHLLMAGYSGYLDAYEQLRLEVAEEERYFGP